MKRILAVLMLAACATIPAGDEPPCPYPMSEDQLRSGVMQCRALCSSWGRDIDHFRTDCKCVCRP